jgi:Holliday junction resolvase RusA-like endonuclease
MKHIHKKISGLPYPKTKTKGQLQAPQQWTDAIIQQTKDLPKVQEACILKVTFLLPPDKFPTDLPYGPDLDNLLKRFLDALKETVLKDTLGQDSCIISLSAIKTKVESQEEAGAILEVLPITIK